MGWPMNVLLIIFKQTPFTRKPLLAKAPYSYHDWVFFEWRKWVIFELMYQKNDCRLNVWKLICDIKIQLRIIFGKYVVPWLKLYYEIFDYLDPECWRLEPRSFGISSNLHLRSSSDLKKFNWDLVQNLNNS